MRLVTVFYEDDAGGQVTNFGLHILALACLADRWGEDRYSLNKLTRAAPQNGNAKLRKTIRGLGPTRDIVAVFDADKVRELYGQPTSSSDEAVVAAIQNEAGPGVRVCLLNKNAEDVVLACCKAMGRPSPRAKPSPRERDQIFHAAASGDVGPRQILLREVPSFAKFVELLGDLVKEVRAG